MIVEGRAAEGSDAKLLVEDQLTFAVHHLAHLPLIVTLHKLSRWV